MFQFTSGIWVVISSGWAWYCVRLGKSWILTAWGSSNIVWSAIQGILTKICMTIMLFHRKIDVHNYAHTNSDAVIIINVNIYLINIPCKWMSICPCTIQDTVVFEYVWLYPFNPCLTLYIVRTTFNALHVSVRTSFDAPKPWIITIAISRIVPRAVMTLCCREWLEL